MILYDVVKAYVTGKVGKFTGAEVIAACPGGSRSAVLGALKRLTNEEVIVKCGTGHRTFYVWEYAMGRQGFVQMEQRNG